MSELPDLYPKDIFPKGQLPPEISAVACFAVRCQHVRTKRFAAAKIIGMDDDELFESFVIVPKDELDARADDRAIAMEFETGESPEIEPATLEEIEEQYEEKLEQLDDMLRFLRDVQNGA